MPKPVVIVTGGASGIGLAICETFSLAGYSVVIADIDSDKAINEAKKLGSDCSGFKVNVTEESSVINSVKEIHNHYGRVDALINNAGIGDNPKPTVDQDINHFDLVLRTHLDGTFLMSREVGKIMIAQQFGSIVNISSIVALSGIRRRNAYSAAKGGIVSMTRALASEWAKDGVRVNAVAPGYVKTELVDKLILDGHLNEQAIQQRTPLKRLARPEEIAKPILFLCSENASYITGTTLSIDGGWTAFGEGLID